MDRSTVWAAVRRPESAAIAGLVFAVLLIVVILELRTAAVAAPENWGTWVSDAGRRDAVSRALALTPFAGIAFLWFIGVVRAQLGRADDRFVETVFLGSGLLFVVTLFVTAAALSAVLRVDSSTPVSDEVAAYALAFSTALLGQFGTRMAAVFTLTLTTAGRRSGALPRWLVLLGYAVGLVLLLTPPIPSGTQYVFPVWVGVLSVVVLVRRRRVPDELAPTEG